MSQRIKIIIGFALIFLVWGSTYLAIRLGVETMPPFLLGGLRFITGGLILYGWAIWRGADRPKLSHLRPAILIGLLMPLGGTCLVTLAETTVPSGLASLLVATVPIWIIFVDWVRPQGSRPNWLTVVGLILGFTGTAMLFLPSDIGGIHPEQFWGALIIVAASLSWATGSIYSRHAKQPQSKILSTGMHMIVGGMASLLISGLTGEFASLDSITISPTSWLALAYLIVFGSAAFAAYVWLIGATEPSKVATYAFVNPIIAIMLGTLVAGEDLTGWAIFCSAIVLVAVFIVISVKGKKIEKPETVPSMVCRPSTQLHG